MASETALAKRESALAERESKIHMSLARRRSSEAIAAARATAREAIAKGKALANAAGEMAAERPIFDAVAEFGGTLAESLLKKKWAAGHDYVGIGAVAVEAICLYELIQGKLARGTQETVRLLASGARGMRARATVEAADKIIDSIF